MKLRSVVVGLSVAVLAWAESPFGAVARKTFADLLVIPLAPPAVQVTVRGVQEEDGLRIEDLQEQLHATSPVTAWFVSWQRGKKSGRLAIIGSRKGNKSVGHGTSNSSLRSRSAA